MKARFCVLRILSVEGCEASSENKVSKSRSTILVRKLVFPPLSLSFQTCLQYLPKFRIVSGKYIPALLIRLFQNNLNALFSDRFWLRHFPLYHARIRVLSLIAFLCFCRRNIATRCS